MGEVVGLPTFRTVTADDIDELLKIGEAMWSQSRYARFGFDAEKVRTLLGKVIPQGLTFLVELHGEVVGAFVGFASPHFFADTSHSSDLMQYIAPEHRKGGLGAAMLREYVRRAQDAGVADIGIGSTAGMDPKLMDRFYKRLGFRHVGGSYVYGG